jgi:hypothetical protein
MFENVMKHDLARGKDILIPTDTKALLARQDANHSSSLKVQLFRIGLLYAYDAGVDVC